MSKLDAQRAMREAKFARNSASAASRREAAAGGVPPVASPTPAPSPQPTTKPGKAAVAAAREVERCGHKSMNGRACTREAGHSEKSHRYT
jgi:hypothetical protein